jgi:hypothetical protein
LTKLKVITMYVFSSEIHASIEECRFRGSNMCVGGIGRLLSSGFA